MNNKNILLNAEQRSKLCLNSAIASDKIYKHLQTFTINELTRMTANNNIAALIAVKGNSERILGHLLKVIYC